MKTSAGILFLYRNKALFVHSTNSSWWNSYTPPKGGIEEYETMKAAAVRETFEEIGIRIKEENIDSKIEVEYINKNGLKYKSVFLFIYEIDKLSDIDLDSEIIPTHQLQLDEVDEARFLTLEEIRKKALPRYVKYMEAILK